VSIDLIVRNEDGQVLLGKRTNRPAKGCWFVPGGRVRRNERIVNAFERISGTELGIPLTLKNADFLGVHEHFYDDNFLGEEGIGTHYVVLAYACRIDSSVRFLPDDQHSELAWWDVGELLRSPPVHVNTKAYFQ
jgi:colanic acid biosynthesis protein WcaH